MWPLISVYAQSTIKKTVEPMVIESLREYKINNFAFDKLRLGSIVSTIILYALEFVSSVLNADISLKVHYLFKINSFI